MDQRTRLTLTKPRRGGSPYENRTSVAPSRCAAAEPGIKVSRLERRVASEDAAKCYEVAGYLVAEAALAWNQLSGFLRDLEALRAA
jgi:hypothetical protein